MGGTYTRDKHSCEIKTISPFNNQLAVQKSCTNVTAANLFSTKFSRYNFYQEFRNSE